MNMKKNLILLCAAVVVVVGFVVVVTRIKPPASPTASASPTADASVQIVNRPSTDVTSVTVVNAKQTYTLAMNGKDYVIKGQESAALDQTSAGSVFSGVSNVTATRLIAQNAQDLSAYGLDKPQATVTAAYTDGTSAVFLIGNLTPTGEAYYFMKQGDPNVYTVYSSLGETFLSTSDALLNIEKLTLTSDTVDTVKVLKDGEMMLQMTSKGTSNVSISSWAIQKPWQRSVDSQQLSTYLTAITALSMDSVADSNPTDLSKYGLDKPKYDITISGTVDKKDVTNELLIGSQEKDTTYTYVKFADSPYVYKCPTDSLSFTGTTAYMLMDKMIILVNISSVTAVDFQGLNQSGTLKIQQDLAKDDNGQDKKDSNGNPVYNQTFTVSGKTIEDAVARYFYETCIGLQTHSLIPAGTAPSSDTPVATLTYTRNSDPTVIKLEFLPYNDDYYAVRMNGETYFLIDQARVQTIADDFAKLEAGTLTVPKS